MGCMKKQLTKQSIKEGTKQTEQEDLSSTVDEYRARMLSSKEGIAILGRSGLTCNSILEAKAGSQVLLESAESLAHIADYSQKLHAAVVKLFVLESEASLQTETAERMFCKLQIAVCEIFAFRLRL